VIVDSERGLFCPDGAFHLDPLLPVERAVLTHAHGDHARAGSGSYLCTPETAALLRRRLEGATVETLGYGERRRIGEVTVSLHPAGHMLGSAQVRVEGRSGVRLMGAWQPSAAAFAALVAPEGGDADVSRPYPFFLASQLEEEPESLGVDPPAHAGALRPGALGRAGPRLRAALRGDRAKRAAQERGGRALPAHRPLAHGQEARGGEHARRSARADPRAFVIGSVAIR
jgi:hypothetical protein